MKNYYSVLVLLILIMASMPSWGLGKTGHQLVCQLSFELLSASQQQQIRKLLAALPKTDQRLINQYTSTKLSAPITFANSCTWPDAVKKQDSYQKFKSWHYLNVARHQTIITPNSCQNNCVTTAIIYHNKQLQQADNAQDKAMALMFVSHWIGDIHQPLHVSFASDLGGNKNKVLPATGRCENLHWYWDECLLYPLSKPAKGFDYVAFKQGLLQKLRVQLSQAPQQRWQSSSIYDWANESLALVRSAELQYCQLNDGVCQSKQEQTVKLSADYHVKHQKLLEQRIIQAAVRLNAMLQQSL